MQLVVDPAGRVRAIYAEDDRPGRPRPPRRSPAPATSSPTREGRWHADLRPVRRPGARPLRAPQPRPWRPRSPGSRSTGSCPRPDPAPTPVVASSARHQPAGRPSRPAGRPCPGGSRCAPAPSRSPTVTQSQLDRTVAARTGESLRTVRRLGFGLPRRRPRSPRTSAWSSTARSAAGPSPTPGRPGDGSPALAECLDPRCDVYFDFDPGEVYAARVAACDRPDPGCRDRRTSGRTDREASRRPSAIVVRTPIASRRSPPPSDHSRGVPTMITLTRRQARCLRGVFRRSVLGIAHRGPDPAPGLRRRGGPTLRPTSVRRPWPSSTPAPAPGPSSGSVALPLDALADLEGRDDATVALEAVAPDRTVARWSDRGIPRSREYPVPAIGTARPVPRAARVVVRGPRPACSTPWPRRPPRPPRTTPGTPCPASCSRTAATATRSSPPTAARS